ncbi:MAG: hypothetical protein VX589_03810 [Myxococcota bacterium]|nr:hypothetical protein [Myxococcota bacterium]
MSWIIIEEYTDHGSRLVVQSLVDGSRYEAMNDLDLDASGVHRAPGAHLYADLVDRLASSTSDGQRQARFVDLQAPDQPWFVTLGVSGRIQRIRLGPDGMRIAVEVQRETGGTEVHVYVSQQPGYLGPFEELAAVCLPDGRSLRRPVFCGHGAKLLCVGEDEQRKWQPFLIDLRRPGIEEHRPQNATSSAHIEVLPFEATVDPDVDALLVNGDTTAYFSCRVRAGRQRQIHRLHLPTGITEAIGRVHVRIDALMDVHHAGHLIYGADGAVWLSESTKARPLSTPVSGGEIRGLVGSADGRSLIYVLNHPDKAVIYELRLADLQVSALAKLGAVTVTKVLGVMTGGESSRFTRGTAIPAADVLEGTKQLSDSTHELDANRALLVPNGQLGEALVPRAEPRSDCPSGVEDTGARSTGSFSKSGEPLTGFNTTVDLEHQPLQPLVGMTPASSTSQPPIGDMTAKPETASDGETLRSGMEKGFATADDGSPAVPSSDQYGPQTEVQSMVSGAGRLGSETSENDQSSDVWTTAGPVGLPPVANTPVQSKPAIKAKPSDTKPTRRTAELRPAVQAPAADSDGPVPPDVRPDVDFAAFMASVNRASEPIELLANLKRYTGDVSVGLSATDFLRRELEQFAVDAERLTEAIFAISAAALVRAKSSRSILLSMCKTAYERIGESGALPEAEEHFAMAAVRAIDTDKGRFSIMAVYDEYEAIVAKTTDALESKGEDSAQRLVRFFADRYRHALAQLVDPEGYEARKRGAIEKAAKTNRAASKPARPQKTMPAKDLPKVDLMVGFEFPTDQNAAQHVSQSAERFQPLASSLMRSVPADAPSRVKDRPSMDLFQVTAFEEVNASSLDVFDASVDSFRKPSTQTQRAMLVAGCIGVVGGLIMAVLGPSVTAWMSAAGLIWLVGGVGLVGGGPKGWLVGTVGYLLSGLTLVLYPLLGTPPEWLLAGWLIIAGALVLGVAALLLHPRIRSQIGRLRPSRILADVDDTLG